MDVDMKLYPISVDVLYDGMLLDFGIYYYNKGMPVLLCKNVVLTESKIRAIRASLKFSDNIYMLKENHDRVLRETAYFKLTQMRVEQAIGYDIMKGIAKDFVHTACKTGIVPRKLVSKLAEEVQNKLSGFDSVLIMQCLNGIRGTDEYLYVHSLNVGFLNGMLANWCGMEKAYGTKLVMAGLVHDLGKLKISPEILNKQGKLTSLEYEAIKRHPEFGRAMLVASGEQDETILDAVLHHHERVNGLGYPERISNDCVSTAARICAISDVYDAMIAERPYKGASTPFVILQELIDTSFSGLDGKLVNTLLKNMITELQGRQVLLSNGAVGKVQYIDPRSPKYPIVNVDGETIKTNEEICCIRIYTG